MRTGGRDLYATETLWLTPDNLGSKTRASILLAGNLAFDIDSRDLAKARRTTAILYEAMRTEPGYSFKEWHFTAKKGFRPIYKQLYPNLPRDATQREAARLASLVLLKQRLEGRVRATLPTRQAETILANIDWKVTLNPRCVIRLVGSTHSGTALRCTRLDPNLIHAPLVTLSRAWRPPESPTSDLPRGGAMTTRGPNYSLGPRPVLNLWDDDSAGGGSSSPPSGEEPAQVWLSNRVTGTPGLIPVFSYPKRRRRWRREVRQLQQRFGLGPLLVQDCEDSWQVVSLKYCQVRHLRRILRTSKSETKNRPKCRIPIRLGPTAQVLPGPLRGSISRPHSKAFGVRPSAALTGKQEIMLLRGIPT